MDAVITFKIVTMISMGIDHFTFTCGLLMYALIYRHTLVSVMS